METELSQENYDLLNENFLYQTEPVIDNSFSVGIAFGTYHCKNWTFRVKKLGGKAWMCDTYFGDNCKEVMDENIKKYEKVFDFREVKRISDSFCDEYEENDLIFAATDSGGYSCGNCHWVKNNAVKSQRLLIEKCKRKIESLEWNLKREKEDLENYKNGTHYDLKYRASGEEVIVPQKQEKDKGD